MQHYLREKNIKKGLKITLTSILVIALIITGLYATFQSRVVQNWLIDKVASSLSERTGAEISIGHVNVAWFSKLVFNDLYVGDQSQDTLFYMEQLVTDIDTLSIRNKRIVLKDIFLSQPQINIKKLDSLNYNFSFLINRHPPDSVKSIWTLNCSKISIKDGMLLYNGIKKEEDPIQNWKLEDFNVTIDNILAHSAENVSFILRNLTFKEDNGLNLRDLSMAIAMNDSLLAINDVMLSTNVSQMFIDSLGINLNDYKQKRDLLSTRFSLKMPKMHFGFSDLAHILPEFQNSELYSDLTLNASGTISSLKGQSFTLSLGNLTNLSGDFYIDGLPDISQTYAFVNLSESYANFTEIKKLDFPKKIWDIQNSVPDFLANIGTFTYKGNFTGFLNDFVTYGTAYSKLGTISADIAIRPSPQKKIVLEGKLNVKSLDFGTIFGEEMIGKASMNGDIKGSISNYSRFNFEVNGHFSELQFNNYTYQNIDVNGNLKNDLFNGKLQINDPNLRMDYLGRLDLSDETPVFDFISKIDKANLVALNLYKDSIAQLALELKANIVGKGIDDMVGQIDIDKLRFQNKNNSLLLKHISLHNDTLGSSRTLSIKSDWLDASFQGNFKYQTIARSVLGLFNQYIPALSTKEWLAISNDDTYFDFEIKAYDLVDPLKVFLPSIEVETPFEFSGFYRPGQKSSLAEGVIPSIKTGKRTINQVKVRAGSNDKEIFCRVKSDHIRISKSINFYNLTFDSHARNDSLKANIYWNNYEATSYSGSIETETRFSKSGHKFPRLDINVNPSKIYFGDSLWTIADSKIVIDSSRISTNLLEIVSSNQRIMFDGTLSNDSKDVATFTLENIDIKAFKPFMGNSKLAGDIDGFVTLTDAGAHKKINTKLRVKSFDYGSGSLGDLLVNGSWDDKEERINTQMTITEQKKTLLKGVGWIDPINITADMDFKFDQTPLSVLKTILPDVFYNQEGTASGNIHAWGNIIKLNLDGAIVPDEMASIGLTSLKTTFFTQDSVLFKGDQIIFPNMELIDSYGNIGYFGGTITHRSFMKMMYDLSIKAYNINIMNTTAKDNPAFYGSAYVSGNATIKGQGENIVLEGSITSEKGTAINIPFDSRNDAVIHNFIQFSDFTKNEKGKEKYKIVTSGFTMNLDVDVTPDAKVQIIFNSQIGDIIKGEGSGNLQVKIDKNFNILLYGDYTIEKGDYLFTFQNLINKRFSINPGGTIKWIGDPYNAMLDITAVYKVKTTLSDLFADNSTSNVDLNRRMPVDCIIKLEESLYQPRIKFGIELPSAEKNLTDQINQLIVTEEDINKQIISLLLLGRFYTPEIMAGSNNENLTTNASRDLAATTASEMFSNQLSNWLSKISDSWDLGVSYRPGNEISTEQLEVALSTQIFNDRVTINGNVANNSDRASVATGAGTFVGDIEVNVKLDDKGKLQFTMYSRANDNLIEDSAPYKRGAGFSYKEEFNTIKDLLNRYKDALLGKNKQKKKGSEKAKSDK